MKWDLDRAVISLEKWAKISGLTAFTKRFVSAQVLQEFGLTKLGEEGMLPIWELSLLTEDGQRYFFGRSAHEAYLRARKALRPKTRRRVDRPARRVSEEP